MEKVGRKPYHIFKNMYTFEEYKKYYEEHNHLVDNPIVNKNPYTEKQLETKYKKYSEKYNDEEKTKDAELREQCVARDKTCRLWNSLSRLEQAYADVPFTQLDVAHIFPKKAFPHMRYNLDNVVLLYRTFHNRLDEQKNPLDGRMMSKEDTEWWWKRIVGVETWEKLKKESEDGRE